MELPVYIAQQASKMKFVTNIFKNIGKKPGRVVWPKGKNK
jgi:hypothetical protein